MPSIRLTHQVRLRIRALCSLAKAAFRAGHEGLAWAYRQAFLALRRGDEITAERWLEKADLERYLLKASA